VTTPLASSKPASHRGSAPPPPPLLLFVAVPLPEPDVAAAAVAVTLAVSEAVAPELFVNVTLKLYTPATPGVNVAVLTPFASGPAVVRVTGVPAVWAQTVLLVVVL
jgi:hypothetical protein